MSDWSGKQRPILERIAELCGRAIPFGTMGGSGGIPVLTTQDIAAAVAMARQYQDRKPGAKRDPPPLATCVRPELLLLHWGGRTDFVPLIAKRCGDAILGNRDRRMVRAAALLSAQTLAGKEPDMQVSCWALDCTELELRHEMGHAIAWMRGELSEAERAYMRALRRWDDVEIAA